MLEVASHGLGGRLFGLILAVGLADLIGFVGCCLECSAEPGGKIRFQAGDVFVGKWSVEVIGWRLDECRCLVGQVHA